MSFPHIGIRLEVKNKVDENELVGSQDDENFVLT